MTDDWIQHRAEKLQHSAKGLLCLFYSALHHNNCMFIAYHAVIIDKAFRQKLLREGGTLTSSEEPELTLAELVPKMRRIGNDNFSEYLDTRKAQLRQLLSSANGTFSQFGSRS